MFESRLGISLLSSALLLGGCASHGATPGPPPPTERIDARSAVDRPVRDEALAAALAAAVAHSAGWPDLRLFTECRRDAGLESLEIFGNGVAILDNERQFEVSGAEIATLLAAFQRAGFAAMPETFGGGKSPELIQPPRPPTDQERRFALRVICRVELSIGEETKRVAQLDEGEQSEALRELSEEFFRICAEASRQGVLASDLGDGLAKIGRGELAAETLRLLLHRRPEANEAVSSEGFLLRLDGRRATSRPVAATGRYGSGRALVLSPAELETLAGELSGRQLEKLPVNLFASEYTDLSIEVLGRKKSVQARRFAGMDAATHGELQGRFDEVFSLLLDLHRRVMAAGTKLRLDP